MSETTTQVVQKVNYTHDAMIDLIIANPEVTGRMLAAHFGYSEGWVSRVVRSDAFRERLAARKTEVVDPLILESVDMRFELLVQRSLEVLQEKLAKENAPSADLALKAADLGARALGYGAKSAGVQINQQFVVAMPKKAESGEEWLEGVRVHQ
jgi:hypothetical protein